MEAENYFQVLSLWLCTIKNGKVSSKMKFTAQWIKSKIKGASYRKIFSLKTLKIRSWMYQLFKYFSSQGIADRRAISINDIEYTPCYKKNNFISKMKHGCLVYGYSFAVFSTKIVHSQKLGQFFIVSTFRILFSLQ